MNRAAQTLGRLARGHPKRYSAAEIERRTRILAGLNARRAELSRQARAAGTKQAKTTTEYE